MFVFATWNLAPMSNILAQILGLLTQWSKVDPTPTPTPSPTPMPTTDLVINAINSARASLGLSALDVDRKLELLAQNWAQIMALGNGLDHGDFAGRITSAYPNTAAGEDIAEGQPDAQGVVDAWMNSPPHRANILGAFNRVGAGSARDQNGTLYWCADFAQVG